jgi:uncharacterized membrane protein required for colicin V production
MKRVLILLLMMCFTLLGITTFKQARASFINQSVSTLNNSLPAGKDLAFAKSHDQNEGNEHFSIDLEQEEEDELLRKQSLLTKYASLLVAFFSNYYPNTTENKLPFSQHEADADSPRYIRLRVLRI